jgi:hypothetical protein
MPGPANGVDSNAIAWRFCSGAVSSGDLAVGTPRGEDEKLPERINMMCRMPEGC